MIQQHNMDANGCIRSTDTHPRSKKNEKSMLLLDIVYITNQIE